MDRGRTYTLYNVFRAQSLEDQIETHSKVRIFLFRSNSFYKDMAAFLCSKTPVQCRSHHQKYEARYKYPHKIIREEKEKIDNLLYIKLL